MVLAEAGRNKSEAGKVLDAVALHSSIMLVQQFLEEHFGPLGKGPPPALAADLQMAKALPASD